MDYSEIARRLYPGDPDEWLIFSDYQPIIDWIGHSLLKVEIGGYSGDTYVLFQNNDVFGYLRIGWGSCSGCDALQSCHTHEDLGKLMGDLEAAVLWMSRTQLINYLINHDWEGDYSGYNWEDHDGNELRKKFIEPAIFILLSSLQPMGLN